MTVIDLKELEFIEESQLQTTAPIGKGGLICGIICGGCACGLGCGGA